MLHWRGSESEQCVLLTTTPVPPTDRRRYLPFCCEAISAVLSLLDLLDPKK